MARETLHRVVLDTNTIVSAWLFPLSVPGKAFEFAFNRGQVLMSLETAAELANVMRREKFDRYLRLSIRESLVANTIRDCEFVETSTTLAECRDPSDNRLLELAIDGRASAVVTGDLDLLAMNPFRGIPILTPRDFLSHCTSL
jgi:uncharacterized protein